MALPTNKNSTSLPQAYRIQIGEMTENRPTKLDYIIITKIAQSGGKVRYVRDAEMTKALQVALKAEGVKDIEKPTYIPVMVIGNLNEDGSVPDSILRTEMAFYWGGRRTCFCDNFRMKTDAEAEADGLALPLDEENIASYIGTAERKVYDKQKSDKSDKVNNVLKEIKHIVCNPAKCPYATGTHDIASQTGNILCKPRGQVALFLPWAPRIGAVAKFVTTSWNSCRYLDSTLREIGGMTNGWLSMIPLRLTLNWKSAQTAKGAQRIPIVYFEMCGDIFKLKQNALEAGTRWNELDSGVKRLSDGVTSVMQENELPEPDLYPAANIIETGEVIIDAEIEEVDFDELRINKIKELAGEVGWADAMVQSKINGASASEMDDLIAELEQLAKDKRIASVNTNAPTLELEDEPFPQ